MAKLCWSLSQVDKYFGQRIIEQTAMMSAILSTSVSCTVDLRVLFKEGQHPLIHRELGHKSSISHGFLLMQLPF